jgi:hypothetical protein
LNEWKDKVDAGVVGTLNKYQDNVIGYKYQGKGIVKDSESKYSDQ